MASVILDDVHVSFPVYDARRRSLRNRLMTATTGGRIGVDATQHVSITALAGVSFSLKDGDRVALVGHNGAGKTTLLRVIAGIYEPHRGHVWVDGKVAPLFDVTLGMDPESTGYENILLRGLFLGLSKREIQAKQEEIGAFSELGDFLAMPLRTYSAGMQARLAVAVSTCISPEILALDEGIGAGDQSFLEKAAKRVRQLTERSAILVLASHTESLIRDLCTSAILLEHGRIVAFGAIDDVLERYHNPPPSEEVELETVPVEEPEEDDLPVAGEHLTHDKLTHEQPAEVLPGAEAQPVPADGATVTLAASSKPVLEPASGEASRPG